MQAILNLSKRRIVSVSVKGIMLAAILVLAAGCTDRPQKQSETPQAPVMANAQPAPSGGMPQPTEVPVPAYGPNPHPNYYYPPIGIASPGPAMQ